MTGQARGHGYLRHVDGLRGVSVLLVVLYHAWPQTVPGGFVGVDVFFVISGFLITRLLLSEQAAGGFSYGGFLLRRIRRLWPSFALVLLVTLGLGWVLLEPEALADLGRSALAAMGFGSNWYFALTTDYFNEGLEHNLLLHSWSLAVEEQFYLVYPLVLIWLARGSNRLLVGLGLIWGLSFAAVLVSPADPGNFFATHLRVWELASGALLLVAISRGIAPDVTPRISGWLGQAGLVLLVLVAFLMPREVWWPSVASLLPVLGAVMCIAFAWRGLEARWLVGLGLISYALYLWHWPLLRALDILMPGAPDGVVTGVILLAIGVAWLAWRFVEEPIRRGRLLPGPKALLALFGGGAIALGLTGWQYHMTDGVPNRFSVDLAATAAAGPDERLTELVCTGGLERLDRVFDLTSDPDRSMPTFSVCWLGGDEPDFLYIGDSHLGALSSAIALRSSERGSNGVFIAQAACPPVPNLDWSFQGAEMLRQCDMMKAVVLDVIATGRIERTMLVGHWDIYGGNTETGLAEFNAAFEGFVEQVVDQTELHVLLDVPTHDFDVPQALVRGIKWPWLGSADWISREAHERARSPYLEIMKEAENRGALFLYDPVPMFCPDHLCLAETSKGPLFYDGSHLTQTGAEMLLDALPDLPH
ncbi:MAG: acyltransferase family protein [Hyphomonadaceae bacterium]